ncbi:MAG: zinc-binding dehydrogenase [Chloroflexota bacterium]
MVNIPDSMPAAYINANEQLVYGQLLISQPKATEVLVKVHAAAVGVEDVLQYTGYLPLMDKTPHVLGCDAAGEIVALGDEVAEAGIWSVGERVLVSHYDHLGIDRNGTHAGYVAVDAEHLIILPDSIDYITAAASGYPLRRAWSGLTYSARLRKRETVVIKGAGTPLGRAAMAICKWKDCTVIALDKPQHTAQLREAGADMVFDDSLSTKELLNLLMSITDDVSASLVVDMYGGDSIQQAIQMLAIEGRILSLATYATEEVTFNMQDLVALNGTLYTATDTLKDGDATKLLEMVAGSDISIKIAEQLPLKAAKSAYEKVNAGEAWGTIVLVPDA